MHILAARIVQVCPERERVAEEQDPGRAGRLPKIALRASHAERVHGNRHREVAIDVTEADTGLEDEPELPIRTVGIELEAGILRRRAAPHWDPAERGLDQAEGHHAGEEPKGDAAQPTVRPPGPSRHSPRSTGGPSDAGPGRVPRLGHGRGAARHLIEGA